jgi:lipoyl(octanoyl) transferase
MIKTIYKNLGIIDYKKAWDYQEELFALKLKQKREQQIPENHLLLCEHPPVFTLGKSGQDSNLLITQNLLDQKGIQYYKINRGGDITFHGPGQIVGYPILDLEQFKLGVKEYIHLMEEVIIRTLNDYQIKSERLDGATGVWLDTDKPTTRKICAIGVKASRHITMHGFAFNVNTDLKYYELINPCGFTDKGVTSMAKELGREIEMSEVHQKIKHYFAEVFGMEME